MRTTLRGAVMMGSSLAVIWCVAAAAEAAGRISVSVTINEGPSACTFTVYVSATSPGPIGGKAPGTAYTTGVCGPAVEVPAGLYDVKAVNTTLWDQPEKWSRAITVAEGGTKSLSFAFEAGMMNLNFTCTPCRAEVHRAGEAASLSSQCGTGSRQLSTGTYDVRFQLGPDLEVWKRGIAITKNRTLAVKPF
jgi:hypothetical protein